MIVRAGIVAVLRTDEGQMLDARHIGWAGAMQRASRMSLLVEGDQIATREHLLVQQADFTARAVAPVDLSGFGQTGNVLDPTVQGFQRTCHVVLLRGPAPALQRIRGGTVAAGPRLGKVRCRKKRPGAEANASGSTTGNPPCRHHVIRDKFLAPSTGACGYVLSMNPHSIDMFGNRVDRVDTSEGIGLGRHQRLDDVIDIGLVLLLIHARHTVTLV